jgi:hypothetical protein
MSQQERIRQNRRIKCMDCFHHKPELSKRTTGYCFNPTFIHAHGTHSEINDTMLWKCSKFKPKQNEPGCPWEQYIGT